MSAFRVGLTGGLAAGKSTVGRWLAEEGFLVVDADRLVADSYRPGEAGAAAVARLFGADCLAADGGVDHRKLAAIVFADARARRELEEVVHPLVAERFETIARGSDGVVVLEATLLVESGLASRFDLVVTVEAAPETRLRRAAGRGLDAAAARRRMEAQSGASRRRSGADRVLWNDGDLAGLKRQVEELVAEIRRRSDGD